MNHCFISYSNGDADDFGPQLALELEGGHQYIDAWFDKRDIRPGQTWDETVPKAIGDCKCLLFIMTRDSVAENSICFDEWDLALHYKKPILVLRLHGDAKPPFRLGKRQWIDFSENHKAGMAKLQLAIQRLDSPEGQLEILKDRLADAQRDLVRASKEEKPRIQTEIEELTKQIETQQRIVDDPEGAKKRTEQNIQTGLERERQPEKPTVAQTTTKFINPPPGIAPNYYQDRQVETKQVVDFLNNDSQRLMTIVGRAGVGKTAMVCRLLKALERGELPDDLGKMKVDGIVYLSETGSHRVNFANVFADLSKLLPKDAAARLEGIYKNPQTSTGDKMRALLDAFSSGRVILLLDNFETLINSESLNIQDSELSDALNVVLTAPHHVVKVILTTRIAPRDLGLVEPSRQHPLDLDDGLKSPYAEEVLRGLDADGRVGLKTAPDALLNKAREKTRGYPRALEALYAILSVDRYTTLEELLELSLPDEVVQKLVGEAFNRLDPSAQKVMQALAVYNRPVSSAAIDYLLQPHLPSIDSALVLNRLVNMHFARREAGRYYLHPADKEYAFSIIPVEKDLTTKTAKNAKKNQKESLRSSRALQLTNAFTQHDLLNRAADYFAQARKSRTEWKKLDDLSAQLAEFELRCEAGNYDTAARVLTAIDGDYLLAWGHSRLMMQMYDRLQGKIQDKTLNMLSTARVGIANRTIGNIQQSIRYYEQALFIAQEIKDRLNESSWLNNLGVAHYYLGNTQQAIDFLEQSLFIERETRYKEGEANSLVNIGEAFLSLEQYQKAEEAFKGAISIPDETSRPVDQQEARWGLAQVYLFQKDLDNAHATIEAALQYDVPKNNHNASALHGIIALRQGERKTAQEAFMKSIAQADEILVKTPDYYDALDAKGLSICGLVVCGGRLAVEGVAEAMEIFKKARKIAPHAGVVKSVLRLFDELVKCDEDGILKDVRKAAEGVE